MQKITLTFLNYKNTNNIHHKLFINYLIINEKKKTKKQDNSIEDLPLPRNSLIGNLLPDNQKWITISLLHWKNVESFNKIVHFHCLYVTLSLLNYWERSQATTATTIFSDIFSQEIRYCIRDLPRLFEYLTSLPDGWDTY